jgi:hypothetical protein
MYKKVTKDCRQIRSLPDDRLGWLISNPILSQDLLDHAAFCDECGRRIEGISRQQAESLQAEIKAACDRMEPLLSRRIPTSAS